METETINEIARIISTMGGDAKEVFMYYFVTCCTRDIIVSGAILAGLLLIVKTVRQCVGVVSRAHQLGEANGNSFPSDVFSPEELAHALKVLNENQLKK
jgi:hypothetical protein